MYDIVPTEAKTIINIRIILCFPVYGKFFSDVVIDAVILLFSLSSTLLFTSINFKLLCSSFLETKFEEDVMTLEVLVKTRKKTVEIPYDMASKVRLAIKF